MFSDFMHSPYRLLIAAAVMAALLCLFPVKGDAPEQITEWYVQQEQTSMPPALERPASADLSEKTAAGCYLHRTLYYTPCGHSVQRREALPAALTGLSRAALEKELPGVIPGAAVTGFSAAEVDIALSADIPCPLHWVLRAGEDGMLHILQNVMGEKLETVRRTDVPLAAAAQEEQQELIRGRIYDDVQALEGYLESLSS